MTSRNEATNWRSQIAGFVEGTDTNLRSIRKDAAPVPSASSALPFGGRVPSRHPEAVASARVELNTLLAAVQGSLADLRVEVAAAKRLSTNASAVVAGDMSPVAKGPANRSSSAQTRAREQRSTSEITPPMHMRTSASTGPYAFGQPFGPLFPSPSGPEGLAVSPPALLAASISTPPASIASSAPQNEELVKAIDQRLLELGHKIERSLERSMEEQSLRTQLQHAVQAAAAMQQQQQQMLLRNSAPSQLFSGFGSLTAAAAAAAGAPSVAEAPAAGAAQASIVSVPTAGGPTAASGSGVVDPAPGPSSLVLLAMNKADAAEKMSVDLSKELQVLQKSAAKESEDVEKRLANLQDASRQHWEKMCQVSSQVESLMTQRSGAAELQAEVARVATKLIQLEANQDRTTAGIDEHQRLMRQLTSALQKLTQEADSEHAISSSRQGELAAKLDAAAARTGELEARMARVADVEARMARLGDVEVKLARLGELEARMARVAEVEARTARLPDVEMRLARLADLEVKVARMGDVESKLSRMGDLEGKLSRFADLEARVARLGDVEARTARMAADLARMGEIESRMSRIGDVEAKMARLSDMEGKLARLTDMELRMARMGDVDAKMARLSDLEAKMARMGDVDARSKQVTDLEARVSSLQTSVAAVTAVAANATVSRSTPPPASPSLGSDLGTQEAVRRLAVLEQQVARLAAAEQSSHVHERERRRGPSPLGFPSTEDVSMRSPESSLPAPLVGLFQGIAGSPGPKMRSSSGADPPRSEHFGEGPPKDILDRIRLLEEAVMQGSFGQGMSSKSMQTVMARMERLEQIVRAENSIEAMAQEARLAVAEEFVLELRRDFKEVVGPTLEKLAAHVTELRKGQIQNQGSPDGKVVTELRALSDRVNALDAQVAEVSAHEPLASARGLPDLGVVGILQERVSTLELQIKELSGVMEDHNSIFGRLQRHQAYLDRVQHELEALRSSVATELEELKSHASPIVGAVVPTRVGEDDVRAQLSTLLRLDEQLAGVSETVASLAERLGSQEHQVTALEQRVVEQRQAAEAALQDLSERLDGQEDKVAALERGQIQQMATEEAVQELSGRFEDHEGKIEQLEQQLRQRSASVHFGERLEGQEAAVSELRKQQREQKAAADAAVQGLSKRVAAQEDKVAELNVIQREQHKAATVALRELAERLEGQEGKVAELAEQQEEQRKALEAASAAAAAVAVTATGAAATAGAGAGAVSRALPPEMRPTTPDLAVMASKEGVEELGSELRTRLEGLRGSIGDVRKELGSKVQVLDAQIRELLAFREEILSSYVELQDGMERASGTADDALQKIVGHEEKLQALSEGAGLYDPAAAEKMKTKLSELQRRVSDSASTQQGRLEALEAKVHALSELLTAASQDSQAAMEARTRAEELAYDLSQAQESLESLALDSGRLAEQLAKVASAGEKTAGQLDRITADVNGHSIAIARLQDGLQRVESRAGAMPQAIGSRSPLPLPPRPVVESAAAAAAEVTPRRNNSSGGETPEGGSRFSMTLPATRTGASQAILNPLYSASSDDNVFGGIMPITSAGSALLPGTDAHTVDSGLPEKAAAGSNSQQQQQLTPGVSARPRPAAEPQSSMLQPVFSGDATVRDKAQFYEHLASKTATENVGVVPKRVRGSSFGASDAPFSQESSGLGTLSLRVSGCGSTEGASAGGPFASAAALLGDLKDVEPMSPGAAATAAVGAVGLAGLRHAAQASGSNRSLPQTPTAAAAQPASPVAAAGALAAVRAARSGGLSGDLSSPRAAAGGNPLGAGSESDNDEAVPGVTGPPAAGRALRVFGREQTFRRGVADEEVPISSSDDEEGLQRRESSSFLRRERTFRRGEADEEVSISSDNDDAGDRGLEVAGAHGSADAIEAPAPNTHLTTTQGFDDDDLDLAGLAPPAGAAPAVPEAAEPGGNGDRNQQDAPDSSSSSSSSSDNGDIDEEIVDEFGVNQPAFDDDEDISSAWPGPATSAVDASPAPGPQSGTVTAGNEAQLDAAGVGSAAKPLAAVGTSAVPPTAISSSPRVVVPAPVATATAAVEENIAQLSTSGALGGPQLAPLQLSSSAAAMFSLSGDNLSRRKLPPLGALPPVGATGSGANPALSNSRGLDMAPPLLRPSLVSLQNSGNLSGHLSGDLQTSLGELPPVRTLAPLPLLPRASALPPVGIPSAGSGATVAAGSDSASRGMTANQATDHPTKPVAEAQPNDTPFTAHRVEPGSPLRSLLSQPVQEPHPSESADHDTPMPALPEPYTDTSGSVPFVENTGDLSGLSQEPSTSYPIIAAPSQGPTPVLPTASEASGSEVVPVKGGPSDRGLAALLDSDSDSLQGEHSSGAAISETAVPVSGSSFTAAAARGGGDHDAAVTEGGISAPLPFPPLSPRSDHTKTLPPLGRPGVLLPLGRPGALPPLGSPPPCSSPSGNVAQPANPAEPASTLSVSMGGSRGSPGAGVAVAVDGRDARPCVPVLACDGAAAAQPSDDVAGKKGGDGDDAEEVAEYDDDFDDGANSSAPRGVSPAVTNAPSAMSLKVMLVPGEDDGVTDTKLEIPGSDANRGILSASDSLSSLAPPLPGTSSRSGAVGAATLSSLPPLPPGARRAGDSAAPPLPASTASRVSILASEDSLALITPPEGAGGGLLEDGSDEDDIFGDSDNAEMMGTMLEGAEGGGQELGRSASRQSAGHLGENRPLPQQQRTRGPRSSASGQRTAAESGGLTIERSNASLDLNGELSVEAERIAAMLSSAQPSLGGAISVGGVNSIVGTATSYGGAISSAGATSDPNSVIVPPRGLPDSDEFVSPPSAALTGIRSIYAPRTGATDGAGGVGGHGSAGNTAGGVRSIYASTAAAAAAVQDSRVQGSLDFNDEDEDVSSSGGDVNGDDGGCIGHQGAMAAAYGSSVAGRGVGTAAAGISDLSRTYSNDSMELEVFRPPPLASAAQQQQPAATSSSRGRKLSIEDSASASSLRMQEQERRAVPAIIFANSLGDLSTSSGAYRVQVVTGNRPGAGCSHGTVRLTLYGSEGTHVAQLRPTAPSAKYSPSAGQGAEDECFREGSSDEFMIDTVEDLGDLSAIYIWHQGEGFSASWYVETVTLEQLMTGLEWTFQVHDWVRGGQRGGRVTRLPGAKLSISRENSLARLASTGLVGSQPTSPLPGNVEMAGPGPSGRLGTAGTGVVPQRRGLAAMGDESMDVSSDMPSPVDTDRPSGGRGVRVSLSDSLARAAQGGRQGQDATASAVSVSRIGVERSGGNATTTSGSVNFSDGDDGDDLLPGMGSVRVGRAAAAATAAVTPMSVFAGATAAATAAVGVGEHPRMARNVPQGIGVVLEEDIEEVDGMLSTSAAFSLGPVSSRSGPALVSPRPPLPPGAPRRRESIPEDFDEISADVSGGATGSAARRQPLPPTPPMNRRNSGSNNSFSGARRFSTGALETDSSLESLPGLAGGYNNRRRVRISGSGDEGGDLMSELSVEGSELSIASAASLSLYAPEGVRPPPLAGSAIGVDYVGTSRKRVSWAEYAEEFEFLREDASSTGSASSLTEEDLLAAQGETVRADASRVGYNELIRGTNVLAGSTAGSGKDVAAGPHQSEPRVGEDGGCFTEVPLKPRRGQHANSYGYKIKVFTADKLNAGLGNSTVHLELLGREATVAQALPKERGTFQRGCVDRFTLYSTSGDMGQLLALKIWHEGKTLGSGSWGFEQVVIDDRLKGNRYTFRNPDLEGVLRKGRRNCLVLKPSVSRIDESEDLAEVAREYETQLSANRDLSELERDGLRGKLDKINQRLSKLGTKLVRSLNGSLGFP